VSAKFVEFEDWEEAGSLVICPSCLFQLAQFVDNYQLPPEESEEASE